MNKGRGSTMAGNGPIQSLAEKERALKRQLSRLAPSPVAQLESVVSFVQTTMQVASVSSVDSTRPLEPKWKNTSARRAMARAFTARNAELDALYP